MRLYTFFFLSFILISCQNLSPQKKAKDLIIQGNEYARDGLFQDGINSYKKALELDPKNSPALRNLGMVLVKIGDFSQGERVLKRVVKVYPKDFEVAFYLAEAARGQTRYLVGIPLYKRALSLKPTHEKATQALILSYIKTYQYGESVRLGRAFLEAKPKNPDAYFLLAQAYLKLKQPGKSLTLLNQLPKTKKPLPKEKQAKLLGLKGQAYFDLKSTQKASELFTQALASNPFHPDYLIGMAKCLIHKNQPSDAIPLLEKAVALTRELPEGHYLLGQIYEKKDPKKSKTYYSNFYRMGSKDPEFRDRARTIGKKITF
jgi:tetratricopeptide (TPR) repeat protein